MRRLLVFAVLLAGVAAAAPLPAELHWIDTYGGLQPLTAPSDRAGRNDYLMTGVPAEVFQVLRDKLVKNGWKARDRYTNGKHTAIVRYCDLTKGPQKMGLQMSVRSGQAILTVYWYNWPPPASPSPTPQ